MRIAIDAMGGDCGPQVMVDGAVRAANDFGYEIALVGDNDVICLELEKYRWSKELITVHHASQVVGMEEQPAQAVRRKRGSSINVAVNLVKEGRCEALVTAGNTGAAVASATLILGLLPGVKRPGIAIVFPTLYGISLLIDVGANIDPRPEHLLQYAIMGNIYVKYILRKQNPSISLLNIGKEESKGTELLRETYKLLTDSGLNFIGNVEGRDVFSGRSDCIICGGFIGNVVLKVLESIAETTTAFFRRELEKSILTRLGAWFCRPAFLALQKGTDYSECGGAPLLGVDGICIIAHGGSTAKAIRNAIKVAGGFVNYKVNQRIAGEIGKWERRGLLKLSA